MIPVLFVDDNRELSNIFQFYLEETGKFSVHVSLDGADALTYLQDHPVQAVISDFDMPDMDGITLLRHIRDSHPRLPFIMLTGNDSKETAIEALNAGADFYQNKAEDLEIQVLDLSHKITVLVEKARAEEAVITKDLILEVISRTAGRLFQGSDFYAEMATTLQEIGRVTGAIGACIGNPLSAGTDPEDPPDVVTWWRDEDALTSEEQITSRFEMLTALYKGNGTGSHDHRFGHCQVPDKSSQEAVVLEKLGITSCVFLPVHAGDEQWGYFCLLYDGPRREVSDPEYYALTMLAELAGAAKYRSYMEEYFKNPIEQSIVGAFLIRNNRFIYINPMFSRIFGFSRAEILRSRSLPGFLTPADGELVQKVLEDISSGTEKSATLEVSGFHRNGSRIYLELYVTALCHSGSVCIIGNCMDITAKREAEEKARKGEELLTENMRASLREKETLLKEIHHRVKNNMQIISSLLRLTDFHSDDPAVHEVIRDCRNRIYSMASIHEKLYETDNLAEVPLGSYIRDITSRIILEFELEDGGITYEVIEDQPISLDINIGIPVGLMMNELITNSIKHAFSETGGGSIRIFVTTDDTSCTIRYSDSGKGLPPGFDFADQTSLGMELIRNLTTQIQGTVSFSSGAGMECTITFPVKKSRIPAITQEEEERP